MNALKTGDVLKVKNSHLKSINDGREYKVTKVVDCEGNPAYMLKALTGNKNVLHFTNEVDKLIRSGQIDYRERGALDWNTVISLIN